MQNNSVSALSSKLIAQLETDKAAIAEQTEKLLKEHANSFNALSSAALNTTKGAMNEHLSEINQLLDYRNQQIRKALALPFAVFLSLCLLIALGAGGWSWWTITEANQKMATAEAEEAQTKQRIQELTTEFCSTPAGKAKCNWSKK
jgi:DNA-directed RNA polymerase delta subunit